MPPKGDDLPGAILDQCKRLEKILADARRAPGSLKFSNLLGEIKGIAERQPETARVRLVDFERELLKADDGEGATIINAERHRRLFPEELTEGGLIG